MNLTRTENGLQVHEGGVADDREIGPEHELAVALNNVADATRENTALLKAIFWRLPPKERADLLGVSAYVERRIRREVAQEQSLGGGA